MTVAQRPAVFRGVAVTHLLPGWLWFRGHSDRGIYRSYLQS